MDKSLTRNLIWGTAITLVSWLICILVLFVFKIHITFYSLLLSAISSLSIGNSYLMGSFFAERQIFYSVNNGIGLVSFIYFLNIVHGQSFVLKSYLLFMLICVPISCLMGYFLGEGIRKTSQTLNKRVGSYDINKLKRGENNMGFAGPSILYNYRNNGIGFYEISRSLSAPAGSA